MSKTRTFKIGDAEIYQDKPSSETKRIMETIHNKEIDRALDLADTLPREIAERLVEMDRSEADLSIVIKHLIREYKRLRQEKEIVTQK